MCVCVTGFMTLFFNTAQTQWIRQNVIDPHSNFLFCRNCITAVLGVHSERLHNQRTIKQQLKENQIVVMTKEDVIDKRLESYVLQSDEGHSYPAGGHRVASWHQLQKVSHNTLYMMVGDSTSKAMTLMWKLHLYLIITSQGLG